LIDAPFKISDECCIVMKEKPCRDYEKLHNVKPIIGLMAEDSGRRKGAYLKNGCNSFESRLQNSTPMGFWTEQDVLQYISQFKIPYCSIYGEIILETKNNKDYRFTTGESRTGCMFCMFGAHLDKVTRFERMKITHPKKYDYCMNNLGLAPVLDYLKIAH
jgi:3'-phosphoadenosine 5'-phosphosulfate sulfotransferase (PAPS reductase)/FAD synthetase